MRAISLLCALMLFLVACGRAQDPALYADVQKRIDTGEAVLVDVREPGEWAQTGVASPAVLLSKSGFDRGSAEWAQFLEANRGRELLLMCRSGNRSGQVASALAKQGYRVSNLGAFSSWKAAGMPTRAP